MKLPTRALAAALAAVMLPGVVAGQQGPAQVDRSDDTTVVKLADMVRTAVHKNLALRQQRLSQAVADANLLASRATFDPTWSLSLNRSTTSTDVVGDTLYNSGTDALTASLDGSLPTSTTYSLSANASNAFARPMQPSVGAFSNNYSTGVSLGLTQPLLRGFGPGAATALVQAARHRSVAAGEDVQRFVEQTISQVENAYYLLEFTETAEDIARASVERAQALYERNTALRRRDLATELDVITARRTLAQRQTSLLDAQRQRVDAAEALLFLVYGQDAPQTLKSLGTDIRTSGEYPTTPPLPDIDQLEKSALASRTDVAAARDRLSGARSAMTLARSSMRPQLDLNLGLDYGGTSDMFRPFSYPHRNNFRSTVFSLGATFSMPQFNRRADAGYQQASLDEDRAEIDLFAVENQVRAEVRVAARGVQLEARSLQSSDSLVMLAEHEYQIARSGLDLGEVTTFQLFQYESDLVAARLTRAQVQYNLATALSAYYLAEGDIGDRYGIDLTSATEGSLP